MTVLKGLWAMVQGDPVFMRRVNGWFTIFWIVMIPISIETGWISSVTYVSVLSLWALVSGHWSAWQAARVEVKQDEEMEAVAQQDGSAPESLEEETARRRRLRGAAGRPAIAGLSAGPRHTRRGIAARLHQI